MAKITLNGTEVEVEEGKNLVDAAEENGVSIPHYCYHPGLSVAGQCRMCYVEIDDNPKLAIACNTKCRDGMKVVTNSEKVESAVKWSLEFHLINHPIDCPICDQAGECGLQDYYMKHGKYESQMRETKVHKEKVVDLGDKIVLDKERCILCGRCVRFTQEVSKTNALGIFNRGDRSVIGTVNDEPMTDNYQVNTVDICPVGALTSKDFRFEQRVWFLDEAESICGGCSKGCNIKAHHKSGKHIYRLKPRYNEQVNGYWMCDEGRKTYKWSNYDKRITDARLGGVELAFDEAIQTWTADLKALLATERSDEIAVWLTPHMTNEELDSIFEQFKAYGITHFFSDNVKSHVENDKAVDGLLYRSDPYPNSRGFLKAIEKQGIKVQGVQELSQRLAKNQSTHLIVFGAETEHGLADLDLLRSFLPADSFTVVISPTQETLVRFPNALSLPSLSHLEKTGTMVNEAGLEQKLNANFKMFKDSRSIQEIIKALDEAYRQPAQKEVNA